MMVRRRDRIQLPPFTNVSLVCQKVIQQRYGFSTGTLSSNRSITPQTISTMNVHPSNSLSQQQSPVSNQVRLISNSHSVPSSSYVAGNIHLAQTAPASVFSSYHFQNEQQPILVPPAQSFPIAQLAQCFNSTSTNGVLKDRNNQQQQQQQQAQLDKRTRSFKEPLGTKLSTLNEAQPLPFHETPVRFHRGSEMIVLLLLVQRAIDADLDANSETERNETKIKPVHGKFPGVSSRRDVCASADQ